MRRNLLYRRATRIALLLTPAALGLSWLAVALASSPVSATLTCGSSYPYQAMGRASISGVQRFIATENTYRSCYYVYLNGNATGSTLPLPSLGMDTTTRK